MTVYFNTDYGLFILNRICIAALLLVEQYPTGQKKIALEG